jgi:hypothetical protein
MAVLFAFARRVEEERRPIAGVGGRRGVVKETNALRRTRGVAPEINHGKKSKQTIPTLYLLNTAVWCAALRC